MPSLPVAVGPASRGVPDWVGAALREAGAVVTGPERAEALLWLSAEDSDELKELLARHTAIRWVQLPWAGIEPLAEAGVLDPTRVWTCAKGAYAEPVAEHAVALALAGLRRLPERVRATSWGEPAGRSLYDRPVTILGGGGITRELLRLLAPYRVRATVLRRSADPLPGAERTLPVSALHDVLPGAAVVFVALALTPETTGIIGSEELGRMDDEAWLVNVARGRHVVTDALVTALRDGAIAGAALDVTDPEPLPDGHPLWELPNCIVTPHTADTWEMVRPLLARRIAANVAHRIAGEPLEGLVDPAAGY